MDVKLTVLTLLLVGIALSHAAPAENNRQKRQWGGGWNQGGGGWNQGGGFGGGGETIRKETDVINTPSGGREVINKETDTIRTPFGGTETINRETDTFQQGGGWGK